MAISAACSHTARLLFVLGALAPFLAAAAPGEAARPKVCIALSGGGALGLAHVGVLRELEAMRVPVDCVAGTSMGAIVGGLYAAGYSPAELEELATTLDWASLVRDAPNRRHLPYRRKVDDLYYLTRWELGVSKRGIRLPDAIVSGHRLGVELQLLTLRAAGIDDFDRLPLPFRAVAADAATAETVVLDRGPLATALRASMAVPGLFAPVEIDGRLLVDGGVVSNLPVAVARELGADVVIAVDLHAPLAERERPESITRVLSQSLDALSQREVARAVRDADVVLRPRVDAWGLLDFEVAAELVARGAEATRDQADSLRAFALDEATWRRHLERQRRATPSLPILQVVVEPGPGLPRAAVARAVRTRPGEALDPLLLSADLERLWELGEFASVGFALEPGGVDGWILRLTGRDKPWGPNFLRTGISLATDLEGESSFGLLAALTMTRLGALGAELKVAAEAAENPLLNVELYQPVAPSRVPFVSLAFGVGERKQRIGLAGGPVQYRFLALRANADAGLALGRWGELRAGYRLFRTESRAFGERPADTPDFDQDHSGFGADLILDQLDRVNFPRSGALLVVDYHEARTELGADEEYRKVDMQLGAAASRGRQTLLLLAHAASGLGGDLPPSEWLGLGGLFTLSGLPPGEVVGAYGGVASLAYLLRIGRLPKFGDGFYLGFSVEAGNAWPTADAVDLGDLRRSIALVFGADTILGPLYLAHGHAEGGSDSFYLYLGRTF